MINCYTFLFNIHKGVNMSLVINPNLPVEALRIEPTESKKPIEKSVVSETALAILEKTHRSEKRDIPENHWGVIDLKAEEHHPSIFLEMISRSIVVVVEGFLNKKPRYYGAAFYTENSIQLLKEMMLDWKSDVDSVSLKIIVPSETMKPFSKMLSKIEEEIKETGIQCNESIRWLCCPDKITIFPTEPRCKVFLDDI